MKNSLLKRISKLNIISHFMLFLLLFGCENSKEDKAIQKTKFDHIAAQQQFESKSPIEKWEFVLEIASANYRNKEQVDNWLLKVAPKLFTDKKNIKKTILNQINRELYGVEVSEPALLFAQRTLENLNVEQDKYLQGYPAATLSNHYQDLNLYDSVNKYNLILQEALNFYDTERLKVIYFNNNAYYLEKKGYLFESAVNYHKALEIINLKDPLTQFTLITNLSTIYYELNYPDKAKFFIDSARSIISFKDWPVEELNLAGLVYSKTKDYSVAKSYFLQAIKKSNTDENLISLAQSYSNYANFNRKIKQYSAAFEYMAKSDSLCKELGVDFGILINRINRAELYYDLNDFEKAAMELKSVKADLSKFSSPKIEKEFYKLSYRINDAIGNENLANSMYRKYVEKEKAFFGDLPRSILAEWELATENEKSIKVKASYSLQKEKQSKEKYILILGASFLFLALTLFFFIRNRKHLLEREKINQEKQKIAFELELKSKQLISESLKNLTIQNTKEELMNQIEEVVIQLPKSYHIKFEELKQNLKLHKTATLLNEFESRFTGVYEQYYEKLKSLAPELTPHELRICALMRLNISTKEIAMLTNRTAGTVDNTRSSIRKKLKLEDDTNLQEYLLNI